MLPAAALLASPDALRTPAMSRPAPVYIGLTTIHGRERALARCLMSLLRQRRPVDRREVSLHLFLSRDPYLLDRGFACLPPWLRLLAGVSRCHWLQLRLHVVPNLGPYRKLLPLVDLACSRGDNDDPLLITADDDTLYPSDWLQQLIDAQERFGCVVAFRGRGMDLEQGTVVPYRRWRKDGPELLKPSMATVPTGKDGICYRLSQLHRGVTDQEQAVAMAGHADDLWFKLHTMLTGTPSVLLHAGLHQQFPELTRAGRRVRKAVRPGAIQSLFLNINKGGGNDEVMKRLDRWLVQAQGMSLGWLLTERADGASWA